MHCRRAFRFLKIRHDDTLVMWGESKDKPKTSANHTRTASNMGSTARQNNKGALHQKTSLLNLLCSQIVELDV